MRASLLLAVTIAAPLLAQPANYGANIRDIPPRAVAEADDPVNRYVAANTVDGMVLALTIDGDRVRLDRATPARVPKPPARKVAPSGTGDAAPVTATGFAGGRQVSSAAVSDQVVNVQEDFQHRGGGGLVRLTRRAVQIALAAPVPLDRVEISAPATGARAMLDVRPAYAELCRASRGDKRVCPASGYDQKQTAR